MAQATGMESTAYASSCDMENEKVRDDSTIFLISNGNLRLQEARQMHNSSRWIRRRCKIVLVQDLCVVKPTQGSKSVGKMANTPLLPLPEA